MKTLIIYYSRSGITRRAAERMSDSLKEYGDDQQVVLEEIVDRTNRRCVFGWLRAGCDATLRHDTSIDDLKVKLDDFDLVVVGTPVWAFTTAPPVRSICRQLAEHPSPRLAFFCTMGGRGDKGAFRDMESLCRRNPVACLTLIDKKVKKEHPDGFVAKVEQFVNEMVQACRHE